MSGAEFSVIDDGHWQVSGDLNFNSVTGLWRGMSEMFESTAPLCLDLANVTRSDSAGLALLIEWLREARRKNKPLSFINIPLQMQAVANSCGVDILLPH